MCALYIEECVRFAAVCDARVRSLPGGVGPSSVSVQSARTTALPADWQLVLGLGTVPCHLRRVRRAHVFIDRHHHAHSRRQVGPSACFTPTSLKLHAIRYVMGLLCCRETSCTTGARQIESLYIGAIQKIKLACFWDSVYIVKRCRSLLCRIRCTKLYCDCDLSWAYPRDRRNQRVFINTNVEWGGKCQWSIPSRLCQIWEVLWASGPSVVCDRVLDDGVFMKRLRTLLAKNSPMFSIILTDHYSGIVNHKHVSRC